VGFRIYSLECRDQGLEFRVSVSRYWVYNLGFMIQGLEIRGEL
jgi:hypothetical protein